MIVDSEVHVFDRCFPIETVHVRHEKVEKHDIHAMRAQQIERARAIGRKQQVAVIVEHETQCVPHRRLIIDGEHRWARGGRSVLHAASVVADSSGCGQAKVAPEAPYSGMGHYFSGTNH